MRHIPRIIFAHAAWIAVLCLFILPSVAQAASAGELVKLADDGNRNTQHDTAVYYIGDDGKRYAFPNAQAYFTWYEDFSEVQEVSSAELAGYTLGGNITYRPGTRLVKITTDPKVYAVEPGGILRWVASESIANALFGAGWNTRIDDIPDTFFLNYTIGSPLTTITYPTGSIVKRSSDNTYFRIEGSMKRMLSSPEVRDALRVQEKFVLMTADALSSYSDGAMIAGPEAAIVDTAQRTRTMVDTPPTLWLVPPAETYIPVGGDAVLAELHISSGSKVTLDRIAVKINATTNDDNNREGEDDFDDDMGGLVYQNNAQANLKAVRFVDSLGNEVFGRKDVVKDLSMDQSQTLYYTGRLAIAAGEEKVLYLRAQVNEILPTDEGYRVTFPVSGIGVTDGTTGVSASFLPTTDLVGSDLTTLKDALEVQVASTPGLETHVLGARGAAIIGFSFIATTAVPNVVTRVAFQGYIDEAEGGSGFIAGSDADNGSATEVRQMIPTVSLIDVEGNRIAGPVSVNVNGQAVFTGLNVSIPSGESTVLIISGDIPQDAQLETNPNRVTFDIIDVASDVDVEDTFGSPVLSSGAYPNNADISPSFYATIKETGALTLSWQGGGGDTLAGDDVLLGKMIAEPLDDSYTVRSISFRHTGTSRVSLGDDVRLQYKDADGNDVSATANFFGDVVTFSRLSIPIMDTEDDDRIQLLLYGTLKTRDAGAQSGEEIRVRFDDAGSFEFVSVSTEDTFSTADLGTGSFVLGQNTESSVVVRFSGLTITTADSSPTGSVYRDSEMNVLELNLAVKDAGGVRIKKMAFKVTPGDVGKSGADNDLLEEWADANGDFADDDSIVNLKQVFGSDTTLIGEGSNGRIRYSIKSGSTELTSPSGHDTVSGDYGLIRYEFSDGSELFFPAGADITLRLELDTSGMSSDNNYALNVELMGGSEFVWTDIPFGAYTPLYGSGTMGLPRRTEQLTVPSS